MNLDLAKEPKLTPIIYGRVGDEDMQKVTVNITNRDTAVDLTGYTITFEGVTSGGKSKVFDVEGVKTSPDGLKKGSFDYLFPNESFSVSGRYETAYFSFIKADQRDTTGDFDIIVNRNADIDAEEAETIITLYNELVEKLQTTTKDYLASAEEKFKSLDEEVKGFQALIDSYKGQVSDIAAAAIKVVNDALEDWEVGNFYTKEEMDDKLRSIIQKDIPENANLDDYKVEGEFSKKTPTVVTGAPGGVTGAFRLSVRTMLGSSGLFQTLYDYGTRSMYFRIGNTGLGFNLPWQKVITDDETATKIEPITMGKGEDTNDLNADHGTYLITLGNEIKNIPDPNGWYYLEVIVVLKTGTKNLVLQRLTELVTNKLYLRTQSSGSGGAWSAWVEK